jgi:hypothetical protein
MPDHDSSEELPECLILLFKHGAANPLRCSCVGSVKQPHDLAVVNFDALVGKPVSEPNSCQD